MRSAVAMEIDLGMVVDVHLGRIEDDPLPALCRQRRRTEPGAQARTAAFDLLELALVQRRQQPGDRRNSYKQSIECNQFIGWMICKGLDSSFAQSINPSRKQPCP